MNVFLNTQAGLSKAMGRIVTKMMRYAPSDITVVNHPDEADLIVLHVIGFPETEEAVRRITSLGKKYAIIQYCLRTTQKPNTADWLPIWAGAEMVWSYYDLQALCEEDGQVFPEQTVFYFSPLGVDSEIFNPGLSRPKYKILTTGTLAPFETVDLVNKACQVINGIQVHVGGLEMKGTDFNDSIVEYHKEISDTNLAQLYRQTEYVSGLRRIEGFELPAAEGLLCGARPILFDRPHYRRWYEGLGAIFIPESTDEEIVKTLREILKTPSNTWAPLNISEARTRFSWATICTVFWESLPRTSVEKKSYTIEVVNKPSRRLVWVGDAVASTGFAKGTHKILEVLRKEWDVHVLGLNYYGDPHDYPYKIYPAQNGGDFFGIRRLPSFLEQIRPEMVVIQNDPWNFPQYLKSTGNVPVIGIVAVDGQNCRGEQLNGLQHAIFWTEFGATEAAKGGYRGTSSVIPLGVDLDLYKPIDRSVARNSIGLPPYTENAFIVGNINRNQPRKRLDLTIQHFCEWVKSYRIDNALLYLHVAPTGDQGYDCKQLMRYYGVSGRLILSIPEIIYGVKESMMPYVYNCFDVQVSTTQGEGFGLTTLEGMACGVPQIFPAWSALDELFSDAADAIPCSTFAATPNEINVIGGIVDKDLFIGSLNRMYKNDGHRLQQSAAAFQKARDPRFQWDRIGNQYKETLNNVFSQKALTLA
jgi:glycosyltransferase involved in cell wall biosynthesis